MIIECDQCSTRYRLDDSRISPNGVKVRCTKCQNVFIVTLPPPAEEVRLEDVFGAPPTGGSRVKEQSAPESTHDTSPDTFADSAPESTPEDSNDSADDGHDDQPVAGMDAQAFASAPESPAESSEQGAGEGLDAAAGQSPEGGLSDDSGSLENFPEKYPGDSEEDSEGLEGDGEDEGADDGLSEAPDLSFGGPDFRGLMAPAGAPAEEGDAKVEAREQGPWFESLATGKASENPPSGAEEPEEPVAGPGALDEGDFPSFDDEDVPAGEQLSDESGRQDDFSFDVNRSSEEPGPDAGDFAINEGAEDEPLDFGFNDDEAPGAENNANAQDGVKPVEAGSSKEAGSLKENSDEQEEEDERDFTLTPPPLPEVKQSGEKVIPFSTGRSSRAAARSAAPKEEGDVDSKFEDLFSRTIAETAREPLEDLGLDKVYDDQPSASGPGGAAVRPSPGKGLILAVLIFLVGGAVIYFSGVIDNLARMLTPGGGAVSALQIQDIAGHFEQNKNFGRFFVIEARIKNTSAEPQSIKMVTGVIYGSRGKSIATRSVSPGRVVTPEDLKNLSKQDLLRQFRDPSGGVIPAEGTVPVMVPFTEIPASMSEYGLNIIRK